ncbi:hypothetical protein LS482_02310 [Sinomicrobium kalidii]|uniref:hypothetical protein n=1 Tax=Sinomicrobium kalidii TaxID=2900738 RepID=UPI001E3BCFE9|nr:hypothetical protein [Sinomicrobium kalidii]UGU16713.1 hypothetical protein LS482_02310 [Sinomicrobium kalidii]
MSRFSILFLFLVFPLYHLLSQPVILVKHEENPGAVENDVRHYMKLLDIRENIHLTIRFTRHVPRNILGITFCLDTQQPNGYRHIVVAIDSGLSPMRQKLILAHEMIHVKQYAKKELIALNKRVLLWKGRKYETRIYNKRTPWETEAYNMERLLRKHLRRKNQKPRTELAATL